MREILTAGRYYKNKFGCKVYKTPVSILGFTCPNIDGTVAKGGCTFCENESFSPNLTQKSSKKFFLNPKSSSNPFMDSQLIQLEAQYNRTKNRLRKKFKAKKFIVYFQSFSNTYAPFDTLKRLYEKALSFDDVVGLSIGTRTDCLSEELLDYLVFLSRDKEIWIEFGIQSVYDKTLKDINRGHDVANMTEWIQKSKDKGLKVCGHLIFGLPNETQEMMLDSVRYAVDLKIDSLKFHSMYITKNTVMANEYRLGKIDTISEELYIDTLIKSFKILPDNVMIQRICAGIGDESLLSPMWCKDKHIQMKHIKEALKSEGFIY